ncbi:MAG: choice-of-anchor tandem repeat GloVer-containing protein [Limisphaerales bacterium]
MGKQILCALAKAAVVVTIFLATAPAGAQTFTNLKSFPGNPPIPGGFTPPGDFPSGPVALTNGVLYGVTANGGDSHNGSLFKLSTNGSGFTVLHEFAGGSDGSQPAGRVVVSGDTIYGVTYNGGTNNNGTITR